MNTTTPKDMNTHTQNLKTMSSNNINTKKKGMWKNLKSAIMYLSDVFIFLMVFTWILFILLSIPAAWVELLRYGSANIFSYLKDACTLPLSVGGTIWLIRICITHNNAQKKGKKLTPDFPNIDDDGNVISNVEMNVDGINNDTCHNNHCTEEVMEDDLPKEEF